jgi:hypothetical protein
MNAEIATTAMKDIIVANFNVKRIGGRIEMKKYIEKIESIKSELKKEFSVNREFSILNTKLEDLEIYLEAYIPKLIKRGEDK